MSGTNPLKVVFAEDEPDVVELVRISIASQPDFELVATAQEAEEALALIRGHHPDVVILDHRLRDRSAAPDATIVIFTGHTGLRTAAENAGADAYVEKPEVNALWPTIRDVREAASSAAE